VIPVGATLIRLSEYKNRTIRIYALGRKLWLSSSHKQSERNVHYYAIDELPEGLLEHAKEQVYGRKTMVPWRKPIG
jgi:hypothetical protein